jgi:hypothetical protein
MSVVQEMYYLKEFQVKRLQDTYHDFMEKKIYQPLGEFFFEELYGPKDHQARDESFERLHRQLAGKFSTDILEDMGKLIALNQLCNELDEKLLEKLVELFGKRNFTMEEYQKAYRACNNYEARKKQIESIDFAIKTFYQLAKRPMVGFVLKSISLTARFIGATNMVSFLRKGYDSFRSIPHPDDLEKFQKALQEREFVFLNHIYQLPLS